MRTGKKRDQDRRFKFAGKREQMDMVTKIDPELDELPEADSMIVGVRLPDGELHIVELTPAEHALYRRWFDAGGGELPDWLKARLRAARAH